MSKFVLNREFMADVEKWHLMKMYADQEDTSGIDFYRVLVRKYLNLPDDAEVSYEDRRSMKIEVYRYLYGNHPDGETDPSFVMGQLKDIELSFVQLGCTACPTAWDLVATDGKNYSARFRHDVLKVYRGEFYNEDDKIFEEKISCDNSGKMHTSEMLYFTGMKLHSDCRLEI